MGGPIRKNSTFFFANWEGFRLSNGLAQIETVPTAMEQMGDFSMTGVTVYDPQHLARESQLQSVASHQPYQSRHPPQSLSQ